MARPTKSAKVLTDKSQTKDEIAERIANEEALRGTANNIKPTQEITVDQHIIFNFIVQELEESKLLGNLDMFLLTAFVIATDRLQAIEAKINSKPSLMYRKEVTNARKIYEGTFFRGINELSLSPQSRAKLANINLNAKAKEKDPLLKALEDED